MIEDIKKLAEDAQQTKQPVSIGSELLLDLIHNYEKEKQRADALGGDEVAIKRIVYDENSGMEMSIQHAGARLIAENLYRSLEESNARNYLEVTFYHPDEGKIVVTLQRLHGKTPHQKLVDAEAEIKKLKKVIEDANLQV